MKVSNLFLESYLSIINESSDKSHIEKFAANAHEEWRKGFDSEYAKSGKVSKPRIKKNSDGTEGDINVDFNKLHPDWKKENLAAGEAALEAIKKYPENTEKAAEHIHNKWMERNPKEDYNAAQHVPYSELPEDEKEKDRVHVKTIKTIIR
jgi:hypothetical protein